MEFISCVEAKFMPAIMQRPGKEKWKYAIVNVLYVK